MERTIRKWLVLGHVSIVLVIALSTMAALISLRSMSAHTERTRDVEHRLASLDDLRTDTRELARAVRQYQLTGDARIKDRFVAIEARIKQDRARLQDLRPALGKALDDYTSSLERSLTHRHPDSDGARARFEEELIQVRDPLGDAFDQIAASERAQLAASHSRQHHARAATWAVVIAGIVAALLTIASSILLTHRLATTIARMRADDRAAAAATARKDLVLQSVEMRSALQRITVQAAQLRTATPDPKVVSVLHSIGSSATRIDDMLGHLLTSSGEPFVLR